MVKAHHIIDPKSSNSIGVFIIGSIIGGFALGVGSQLASKTIEHFMHKGKQHMRHIQAYDQHNYGYHLGRRGY